MEVMNMAKALKGLKRFKIFPITANTASSYTVGTAVPIGGMQSLSFSPETQDWKQYADDGLYDSGSDWLGCKFTLQLAECPIDLKQYFEGGEYNETTDEYTYHSDDQAPELAASFAALQSDGTYQGVKLFSLKCTSYKNDYKTKGESGEANPVTIEGTIMNKKSDNAVKTEKELENEAAFSWLDSLE
jgi:phi13 family phage major tail protein